jgi:hypothetical protein
MEKLTSIAENTMTDKKMEFSWRGWTTFVLTISFIVDTISGIILYIAPPGRIANWTNWNVWGLDKEAWVAIHTIFGYVILIIVGLHLFYNWRMFINFIWSKLRKALNLKKEMITATLICLLIFLGTLWNIPPFSSTMDLGGFFKESWEVSKADVPIAHAELLSLKEFSQKINVPIDQIQNTLQSKGYRIKDVQQTMGDIAKENRTSPDKLYEVIKAGDTKPTIPETIKGSGIGRKTLEAICDERGFSLADVLARLDQKGIKAKPRDKLKDIASKLEITPIEVFAIIEGKEQ